MAALTQRFPILRFVPLLVILVVIAGAIFYFLTGGSSKTGTAYFKSAKSVYVGDAIEVLSIKIGEIDKVTPEGDKVRVDFHYDGKYSLPADAKAAIMSPTLVATRYIALAPAYKGGPALADGAVIPLERTASPVEFDELKKQLDLVSDALGPNGVNKDGALNRALEVINKNGVQDGVGQGQPFHDMVSELSKAARTLSDSRGDLFGTVKNLAHFTSELNQYDSQIVTFQNRLGDVSEILDDNSDQLRTLLPRIDDAAYQVDKFIREHGDQLTTTVDRAASVSRALAMVRDEFAQALHIGPTGLTDFLNLFHPRTGQIYGDLAINYLDELGPTPGNAVCGFITAAANANELTAQRQCVQQLGPLFTQLQGMNFIQQLPIPPQTLPVPLEVPQGSTPSYGDFDSLDQGKAPDTAPSPNGSNSDIPRSSTANGNDRSYSDNGFPIPGLAQPNGGN